MFKVARREDARQRSGDKMRTVHLGRTHGRDRKDLANSGVRMIKAQVLGVQSRKARGREAAKWQDIYSRPSGGTGGERSRDLANSGIRRLRVQTLGTPSREVARYREKDSRQIRITGGPLDLCGGSHVARDHHVTD